MKIVLPVVSLGLPTEAIAPPEFYSQRLIDKVNSGNIVIQ